LFSAIAVPSPPSLLLKPPRLTPNQLRLPWPFVTDDNGIERVSGTQASTETNASDGDNDEDKRTGTRTKGWEDRTGANEHHPFITDDDGIERVSGTQESAATNASNGDETGDENGRASSKVGQQHRRKRPPPPLIIGIERISGTQASAKTNASDSDEARDGNGHASSRVERQRWLQQPPPSSPTMTSSGPGECQNQRWRWRQRQGWERERERHGGATAPVRATFLSHLFFISFSFHYQLCYLSVYSQKIKYLFSTFENENPKARGLTLAFCTVSVRELGVSSNHMTTTHNGLS
jgi:hypothetical protein